MFVIGHSRKEKYAEDEQDMLSFFAVFNANDTLWASRIFPVRNVIPTNTECQVQNKTDLQDANQTARVARGIRTVNQGYTDSTGFTFP